MSIFIQFFPKNYFISARVTWPFILSNVTDLAPIESAYATQSLPFYLPF